MQRETGGYDEAMASYSVYLPPDGTRENARFLSDGKSLFALVLPPLFLLVHRLWFALGMYVLAVAALGLAGMVAGPVASFLLSILPGLYLFIDGRQLVRGRLERAGWREVTVVSGESVAEAEQRYFGTDRATITNLPVPRSDPSSLARPLPASGQSGIGLFG